MLACDLRGLFPPHNPANTPTCTPQLATSCFWTIVKREKKTMHVVRAPRTRARVSGWAQMGGGSGRAGLLSHRCGELGPPALVQMSHRISVVIVTASAASNPPALASLTILLGPVMADTTQAATQWGCGGRRGRLRGWRCGQCNSGSRVAYACRKRKRVGIKRVCCRACGVDASPRDASQGAAEAAGASLQ